MIDMVVDERSLGLADRFFDGVKLLGEVETGTPLVEHRDDAAQVAFSPFQPFDDIRVGSMGMLA